MQWLTTRTLDHQKQTRGRSGFLCFRTTLCSTVAVSAHIQLGGNDRCPQSHTARLSESHLPRPRTDSTAGFRPPGQHCQLQSFALVGRPLSMPWTPKIFPHILNVFPLKDFKP